MKFGFEDDDKVKREFNSFEECYNEVIAARSKANAGNDMYRAAENNYKK